MRRTVLVALLLATASPVSAQTLLGAVPDRPLEHVNPGSTVALRARMQNPSSFVVYLAGISAMPSQTFSGTVTTNEFMATAPDSLLPGESWEGTVGEIQVPPGTGTSTGHRLDFFIDGGVHRFDSQIVAQVIFIVDDSSATTGVRDPALPLEVALRAVPNPSAGSARIEFALPEAMRVDVRIYDLAGRMRRRLARGEYPAGRHSIEWNGRDQDGARLAPGVYFVRLETPLGTRRLRLARVR